MTKVEMECFESVEADINLYWLPGLWFVHHLREAQLKGRVTDSHGAKLIMEVCFLLKLERGFYIKYIYLGIFGIPVKMWNLMVL